MQIDSIQMTEGAKASNLTLSSGVNYPTNPTLAELFFKTDTQKLSVHDGTQWRTIIDSIGDLASVSSIAISSDITTVDNIQFDTGVLTKLTTVGSMSWNDIDGCLDVVMKGGNVTLQVGQEQLQRMVNKAGIDVSDMQVVYLLGSTGSRVTFDLASSSSEALSKNTFGVATEHIIKNEEGFVTTDGLVRGLNTSAWAEGDILFLGSTPGSLTNVEPVYPNHRVQIGIVVRSHPNQGSIYVNPINGYELNELHDILFSTLVNGNFLYFDGSKWINSSDVLSQGKLGYGAGAGSIVTQIGNRGSSVILNKLTGQITLVEAAMSANSTATFVLNNSLITSADTVQISIVGGTGIYFASNRVSTGTCEISLFVLNTTPSEVISLNFTVLKGQTA